MKSILGIILTSIFLFQGCVNSHFISREALIDAYHLSPDSVVVTKSDEPGRFNFKNSRGSFSANEHALRFISPEYFDSIPKATFYGFKNGSEIRVKNDENKDVILGINLRTQLLINKGLKNQFQTYFASTSLFDSSIVGYRSVILMLAREIPISEIKSIEIQSEGNDEIKQ